MREVIVVTAVFAFLYNLFFTFGKVRPKRIQWPYLDVGDPSVLVKVTPRQVLPVVHRSGTTHISAKVKGTFDPDEIRVLALREQAHILAYLPGGGRFEAGLCIFAWMLVVLSLALGHALDPRLDPEWGLLLIGFFFILDFGEFRNELALDLVALRATGDRPLVQRTIEKLLKLQGVNTTQSDRLSHLKGETSC